ncbi:MAG: hypothetical protein IPM99_06205 [Rubrivivax sp.]|nr:hypothetical protein [Rubrivivax sp.]
MPKHLDAHDVNPAPCVPGKGPPLFALAEAPVADQGAPGKKRRHCGHLVDAVDLGRLSDPMPAASIITP